MSRKTCGEWMWVRVSRCDDEKRLVYGTLDSEPLNDYFGQIGLGSELAVGFSRIREHRKPTEFTKPPTVSLQEILVSEKAGGMALARQIVEKAKAGEDFVALAAELVRDLILENKARVIRADCDLHGCLSCSRFASVVTPLCSTIHCRRQRSKRQYRFLEFLVYGQRSCLHDVRACPERRYFRARRV